MGWGRFLAVVCPLAAVTVYGSASFVALTFDFAHWPQALRAVVLFSFFSLIGVASLVRFSAMEIERERRLLRHRPPPPVGASGISRGGVQAAGHSEGVTA